MLLCGKSVKVLYEALVVFVCWIGLNTVSNAFDSGKNRYHGLAKLR